MAFNRKAKLRDNIEAIRTVFELDKEKRLAIPEEKDVLSRYCGFGGLKCILNPATNLSDTVRWTKSDLELFPMTAELHRIVHDNSANETEYKRYVDSLKSSVLTAFYTPSEIVSALADTLHEHGVIPQRLLDPSAGQGAFIASFAQYSPHAEVMAFEKDLLTGKLLSLIYPEHKIRIEGFEKIELPLNGYFDVVTSNIPFGDVAVFDPVFSGSKNNARRQSTKAIHNYFFAKGLDAVRDGGVVAFITSQGVMNAPQYEVQRRLLMENADLVSAIRLPNNLFTEIANTEVGSDLIVLQKHSGKEQISAIEQAFLKGYVSQSGTTTNQYFQDGKHIIFTSRSLGTDPYGKPAMIYLHQGGVAGIAADLRRMLTDDFSQRLDKARYQGVDMQSSAVEKIITPKVEERNNPLKAIEIKIVDTRQEAKEKSAVNEKPEIEPPVISLYDLFGFSEEEKRIAQTIGKQPRGKRPSTSNIPGQRSLFDTFSEAKTDNQATTKEQETAKPLYPVFDAREEDHKRQTEEIERQKRKEEELQPRSYSQKLEPHHREGSLVQETNLQVGYLKGVTKFGAMFHPLNLPKEQKEKAQLYISIRDSYQRLYTHEAEMHEENKQQREYLNSFYDEFVQRYGFLNTKANVKLIMMDASGRDILSLERVEDGHFVKADIFDHPVAFSQNETTHVDLPEEALSASLNKYGEVNLDYMQTLCDYSPEELISELKGRIFFNPLIANYEIQDRFVAGNVVEKAE